MAITNPYLKTQIETASKEQLVIMLFDGIVRFSEQARKAIVNNEVEDAHHNLMRAQAIIMELIYTVDRDKGGEVAQNLLSLHAYAFNCLIIANMRKDTAKIDEVQKIYRELREGWVGAMQNLGLALNNSGTTATPPPPPAEAGKAGPSLSVVQTTQPRQSVPAPSPKTQGYGPGRTIMPQSAIPPSDNQSSVIVSTHQQQRSAQVFSAYGAAKRNIA